MDLSLVRIRGGVQSVPSNGHRLQPAVCQSDRHGCCSSRSFHANQSVRTNSRAFLRHSLNLFRTEFHEMLECTPAHRSSCHPYVGSRAGTAFTSAPPNARFHTRQSHWFASSLSIDYGLALAVPGSAGVFPEDWITLTTAACALRAIAGSARFFLMYSSSSAMIWS